jgi:hypothetical protein
MASIALKSLYRNARKAQVGCIVGEHALSAWRAARILRKWGALETIGAVRLRAESDDTWEPIDCDCGDPRCKMNDPNSEAFGLIGEHRTDFADMGEWSYSLASMTGPWGPWFKADTIWGCVGYNDVTDWRENEYALDIMDETIRQFAAAWKAYVRAEIDRQAGVCPACHGTGRVS